MEDRFKLRLWDKEIKKMHYNDFVISSTGYVAKVIVSSDSQCLIDQNNLSTDKNCVVMQCTGLKDKNGKLIYEGDIVDITTEIETTAKIEWSDDLARFTIHFEDVLCDFDNYNSTELEVLGNIYEDPELLKDGE